MEPIEEFEDISREITFNRYFHFSCGHIIPEKNFLVLTIAEINK